MTGGDVLAGEVLPDVFGACRRALEAMLGWLEGPEALTATHAAVESRLEADGRELLRLAFQGHLDERCEQEARPDAVIDAAGVSRNYGEAGHERTLGTVFGEVVVRRVAYRRRGQPNLHPADGLLNLPAEHHSHGLRRLAAVEASRDSFDGAVEAIGRVTGQQIGKRQVEDLARRAAVDFADFYTSHVAPPTVAGDVVVISVDGKGIVMRADALRPATATAAAATSPKLQARLSKGEKRNRKRMSTVGAVYDATPVPRQPADILAGGHDQPGPSPPAPAATNKWLTASVIDDATTVVSQIFDEAQRRDPNHRRRWIALVDGNNPQIDRIHAEAAARQVTVTVICDFVHVLEYLWAAAWSFHDEGDPSAETWVRHKALAVLAGNARSVAANIRRSATARHLDKTGRLNADACANYLTNKATYLDYPTALKQGWPIATGVIEGACRHLVKDRMDITGARWGLAGAEAILKLRALRSNDDFDTYWTHHLKRERQRVHETLYAHNIIPQAA
jgi:hypothetical protein